MIHLDAIAIDGCKAETETVSTAIPLPKPFCNCYVCNSESDNLLLVCGNCRERAAQYSIAEDESLSARADSMRIDELEKRFKGQFGNYSLREIADLWLETEPQ